MYLSRIFSTLFFAFVVMIPYIAAMQSHLSAGDRLSVESRYIKAYILDEEKPNTLCDLPTEKKFAICKTVLQRIRDTKNVDIYFNKAAAFFMTPNTETHEINFLARRFKNVASARDMFPCYGRHNPTRTDWNVDEFFDKLYISGGPERNSLFVYERVKKYQEEDKFRIYDLIAELVIDSVMPSDVAEELKLLEVVSYNGDVAEIEKNWVQEAFTKDTLESDPVCELKKAEKLALCQMVFDKLAAFQERWTIDEAAFHLAKCEKKNVEFMHERKFNKHEIKFDMFKCFGKFSEDYKKPEPTKTHSDNNSDDDDEDDFLEPFYLANGFRRNSAVVFLKMDSDIDSEDASIEFELFSTKKFSYFIENLDLANLSYATILGWDENRDNQLKEEEISSPTPVVVVKSETFEKVISETLKGEHSGTSAQLDEKKPKTEEPFSPGRIEERAKPEEGNPETVTSPKGYAESGAQFEKAKLVALLSPSGHTGAGAQSEKERAKPEEEKPETVTSPKVYAESGAKFEEAKLEALPSPSGDTGVGAQSEKKKPNE